MIRALAIGVIMVVIIVMPASGYHTDIPECVDGDAGWYMISGNDDIGLTVFLMNSPLKYEKDVKDPNKFHPIGTPDVKCALRSDAIVYVFRGKRV